MKNVNAVTVVLRAVILYHEEKSFSLRGIVTKITDGCAETAKVEN